ncbi:hypothetical protein PTMSG1_03059 [Pyrenophora teres f. maculata]|nr:hypothetical protein PTMSG1_03059 [Pyrenophora teres f. maculata]
MSSMISDNEIEIMLLGGGICHSRHEYEAGPPVPPPNRVATVEIIEKLPMSEDDMQRGLDTIGSALASADEPQQYRIIGAGALWAIGIGFRDTADFDILVASGTAAAIKKKLLQNSKFGETKLKSTFVKIGSKNFNVDIIPHLRAHLQNFPSEEYPQYSNSASIAPLECMIESKIGAYRDISRAIKIAKHNKDGDDSEFLFRKAVEKGLKFGLTGMSGLDHDFVDHFRNFRREAAMSLDSLTTLVDGDGDVEMANV